MVKLLALEILLEKVSYYHIHWPGGGVGKQVTRILVTSIVKIKEVCLPISVQYAAGESTIGKGLRNKSHSERVEPSTP